MINYNNLISKIAELKNVKLIQRRLKINTQKSVILYEKPKTQLLPIIQSKKSIKPKIQKPIQKPIHQPIQKLIQFEKNDITPTEKKNETNYCRLAIISIAGFSTLSFCSYGYLVFNNLELLCLL
jgi:hypothetical protein